MVARGPCLGGRSDRAVATSAAAALGAGVPSFARLLSRSAAPTRHEARAESPPAARRRRPPAARRPTRARERSQRARASAAPAARRAPREHARGTRRAPARERPRTRRGRARPPQMARIVLALAAGAAALAPGSKPAAQTRRELGQGLVAAVGALGAQAAVASAGDSPKFSFFGFFGNGGTLSEGAMYGSDQATPTYSPYSVYGKLGDEKAVYKKYNAKEIDFKKKMLAESERRVKAVDAAIGKKNWESVRRDLDGQVYNMRNTMNYLAAGPSAQPGAKAAAKQFYQDMEAVNLLCKRKKQAAAQDAYGAMMSSLDSFNKLI